MISFVSCIISLAGGISSSELGVDIAPVISNLGTKLMRWMSSILSSSIISFLPMREDYAFLLIARLALKIVL